MRIDGPFLNIYKLNNFFIISCMLLCSVSSALGVIYIKHKNRTLHMQLQKIYAESSNLNTEWSNLLLEKSTLLADFRVEELARSNLSMINPEQIYIIR